MRTSSRLVALSSATSTFFIFPPDAGIEPAPNSSAVPKFLNEIVKVKRLPLPGSLSSQILPPCSSTNALVIASLVRCLRARLWWSSRLIELVEHGLMLLPGDADAGVDNGDLDEAVPLRRLDPDLAARGCKLRTALTW